MNAIEVFAPLGNRILVRMEEEKEGLIIKPESSKDEPKIGVVIAVGPGKYAESGSLITCKTNVGDRIAIGQWVGQEVTVNGEKLRIVRDDDVLGVYRAEP